MSGIGALDGDGKMGRERGGMGWGVGSCAYRERYIRECSSVGGDGEELSLCLFQVWGPCWVKSVIERAAMVVSDAVGESVGMWNAVAGFE